MTTNNLLNLNTTNLVVAQGGTGINTVGTSIYSLLFGGTTPSGPIQVLPSNFIGCVSSLGAASLPTFTTYPGRLYTFYGATAGIAQTYAKTSKNVNNILIEMLGGGGGGGGVASTTTHVTAAGGGASGGYVRKWITNIGVSYTATFTVGTGGSGGSPGNNNGSAGNASTWSDGTYSLSAAGGGGGHGSASVLDATGMCAAGGTPGTSSGGDMNCNGAPGGIGIGFDAITIAGGGGCAPKFGTGINWKSITSSTSGGTSGIAFGSGGSGACGINASGNQAGGTGSNGRIIIWEFS